MLLTGVIGFLVTPVMVHLLGDGDYGLWVTVFSLTGYFGLVDQGIRPSLVRYVSRDHAAGDRAGLERTLSSALALYGIAGVVTLAVLAVLVQYVGTWFHIAPGQLDAARTTVVLAGLSLAIGFPFGVFGATLSGLQRYDLANLIGIGIGILRGLLFVAVLRLGGGIVALAWAALATNLAGHLLSLVMVRRLLPGLRVSLRLVDAPHLKRVASYSGIAFIGALASGIAFQSDALVITAFLGAALVTPFALAAGLIENVRTLVHSATWVLSPTASEMETLGEADQLRAMLIAGAKYSVLLSWPVLAALILFADPLMATWVGERYATQASWGAVLGGHGAQASAAQLMVLLALPTMISLPQSTASSVLYGISRHRGIVALSLLNAALNLGLSLWWVRSLGLVGVALGTAVPLALVAGLAVAVYAARALRLPVRRYLWEGMGRPGLISFAFILPALAIRTIWHPIGWVPLGLAVGVAWLPFAACAWWLGVTSAERRGWARAVPSLFGLPVPSASAASGAGQ